MKSIIIKNLSDQNKVFVVNTTKPLTHKMTSLKCYQNNKKYPEHSKIYTKRNLKG